MKYHFLVIFLFVANILIGQSVYKNDLIKLKLNPPLNWLYAGTKESKDNLKKISFTDEQLKSVAASSNGIVSQISYYKYRTDSIAGFIPTISIIVRLNPADNESEFKDIMIASANKLATTLDNFEFIDKVATKSLSNHNCVYYSCKYSLSISPSQKYFLIGKTYNVYRGKYFASITLMDNETNNDCSKLFDEVIKSVIITD